MIEELERLTTKCNIWSWSEKQKVFFAIKDESGMNLRGDKAYRLNDRVYWC